MDDKALLQLIGMFYSLLRARGGLFELFGTKSSSRIDVIKVRALVKYKSARADIFPTFSSNNLTLRALVWARL